MKKLFTIAMFVFAATIGMAQQPGQRICGTMEALDRMKAEDPNLALRMQDIENQTAAYVEAHKNGNNTTDAVVTIPVVIHVLYATAAQNISDARCIAQVSQLNLDYARTNTDAGNTPSVWQGISANTNIQFCLAQRDPSGAATTGIIHKSTTTASFSSNDNVKHNATGGDDAWDATKYFNLWVCNLGGGLLGYAQFPGGAAATDGVVVLYSSVGSMLVHGTIASYNLGRTATHEVGHWLNLRHINGDGNCASDLVSDTPTQDALHFGCPTHPYHVNVCSGSTNGEMFMNYMDYTDDACMNMFTAGQSTRMNALFVSGGTRFAMTTSLGCTPASNAPVAAFTQSATTGCVGTCVNFTDASTNSPTSWAWSFPGATTTSSTSQSPTNICYQSAGTYTITLTATNGFGSSAPVSHTITISGIPTTSNAGPDQFVCATTATMAGNTPVTGNGAWSLLAGAGSLTSATSPTSGVTGLGIGVNRFKWTISSGACPASSDTVQITRYANPTTATAGVNQVLCDKGITNLAGNTPTVGTGLWTLVSGAGTITDPTSPTSGVTGLGTGANVFQWTITNGTCPPSTSQVTILVDVTTQPTINAVGPVITSSPATTYQWYNVNGLIGGQTGQTYNVTVSGYYHVCVTDGVACVSCSDSIYVDATGINNPSITSAGFSIYPNPSQGNFEIIFSSAKKSAVKIEIADALGKIVYSSQLVSKEGENRISIVNKSFAKGIYLVKITSGDKQFKNKLVIQ